LPPGQGKKAYSPAAVEGHSMRLLSVGEHPVADVREGDTPDTNVECGVGTRRRSVIRQM